MLALPTGEYFVKFSVTYDDARDDTRYYPQYLYFSSNDSIVRELDFFKKGSFSLSATNYPTGWELMFDGYWQLKPDGTKAVDAFRYADHLNFLDLVKNCGFSMHYSEGWSVDELATASLSDLMQKFMSAYNDVVVTDDYVLALYSGKPEIEGQDAPYTTSAIRIFDWNGNPLALIHVDKELGHIAYDQRTKRLYTLDFDYDENIMYYELDDVI